MKRYRKQSDKWHDRRAKHLIERTVRQEQNNGFKCSHCKKWVVINSYMGTANRNHCNICLWSKHVDTKKGDRRADCQAGMRPIGLTFRIEDATTKGEIMLIHDCQGCDKISINRIAADDAEHVILSIFEASLELLDERRFALELAHIYVAGLQDKQAIYDQLFGIGQNPRSSTVL